LTRGSRRNCPIKRSGEGRYQIPSSKSQAPIEAPNPKLQSKLQIPSHRRSSELTLGFGAWSLGFETAI
jgi:hypothetical protein